MVTQKNQSILSTDDAACLPEVRDDAKKMVAAACRATLALLEVNSNKPGGGGMAMYHQRLQTLRRKIEALPKTMRQQAQTLLDAANAKSNFQGKTPGSWRRFLPELLKVLQAKPSDIQNASLKANPKGLTMAPVFRALR